MKSLVTMTIATAAIMAAVGVASAQTMEAKIPFAFRTNGKVLAPGTYRVELRRFPGGTPVLDISDRRSGQHVLAAPYPGEWPKAAWKEAGNSVLAFDCTASGCSLRDVWMGDDVVYQLPKAKRSGVEAERAELVVMYPVKSE